MKSAIPLLWAAMALVLNACASYDHKAVQYESPDAFTNAVERDGISIAVDAIDTEEEALATFDEPVTRQGFYPVKIVLRNDTQNRVLVVRDTVRLRDASGQSHHPVGAVVMAEAVEDNAMAYGLLGFGLFSYASATEANEERTADYQRKELKEAKVVQPGRQHGAFVYFELPESVDVNSAHLLLDVEHMGTDKVSFFEVPVGPSAPGS